MVGRTAHAPLDLGDERKIRLVLQLPESLHLALYHYCLWRKADAGKIQVAATKALEAFFTGDRAFTEWRATQPSLPARVPPNGDQKVDKEPPAPSPKAAGARS